MSTRNLEPGDNRQPLSLSRRSFILGSLAGAASLFLEPVWQDGNRFAYAAETDDPEFKVFVVSSKEIGIAAVDVTGDKNVPLPGAKITLTKHSDKEQTLTGTTDEDGNVVFNIETLGDVIDLEDEGKIYQFDGSVDIEKDGYRRVSIKRMRCTGGSGMKVPTRLLTDQNFVYFKSMSFNEWDIQYTRNSFLRVEDLATTHDLAGEIEAPGKSKATVEFIGKNNQTGEEKTIISFDATFKNGIATFNKTDHFLAPSKSVCLQKNTTHYFQVTFSKDEKIRFETGLTAVDPPIDTVLSGGSSFLAATQSTSEVTLGPPIPSPLQGSLSIWRPQFPLILFISPLGYAMFGVSTHNMTWLNTSPLTQGSQWKREGYSSAKQQFDKLTDIWRKQIDNVNKLKAVTNGKGAACKFTSKLTASLAIQAYALSTFDWSENGKWTGSLNALVQFSASVTFTWTFVIGPVPLFVNLTPGIAALLSGSFGISAPSHNPKDIAIDRDHTNLGFNITISVGLEFGLGISGFASISARGSGYFTVYVGYELKGAQAGLPLPRAIVGAGFNVELVVQVAIFKWSGKLWSISWPRIYDSWANIGPQAVESQAQGEAAEIQAQAQALVAEGAATDPASAVDPLGFQFGASDGDGSYWAHQGAVLNDENSEGITIEQFLEEAVIVSEGELAKTAEVSARQKAGFTAPSITVAQLTEVGESDGLFVADMTDFAPYLQANDGVNSLEEFEYEYIGQDEDEGYGFTAEVDGVGEGGGVKPTIDKCISRNIFSNPLQKTALFHSTPYMFRIVSVTYTVGNETLQRSRLSVQRYNSDTAKWERPKVIDLPMSVTVNEQPVVRTDTFDYDFDVIVQSEELSSSSAPNGIHVLLVSGTRPQGDTSTFTDVAASQIMTWFVLDEFLQVTTSYTWTDTAGATGAYSCPSVPRLVALPASDGSSTSTRALVAMFLRRSADSPLGLFSDGANVTAECVLLSGMKIFQGGRIPVNSQAHDLVLSQNTGTVGDKTTTLSFTAASRSKSAGVRITTVNLTVSNDLGSKVAADVTSSDVKFSFVENVTDRADITDFKVWPNRSAFLTVSDGILYASAFDATVANGELTTQQVGPSSTRMASFMVSQNGDVLFYTENREGDNGQTFDEEGNTTPVKVNIHTIRASIFQDDLFSETFPLAETEHPLDSLMAVNGGQSYTFLSTSITDMSTSAADLYFIDVPVVATATPLGFVAVRQFVEQGEKNAPFEMTVRNDGNVILKGCTVSLVDAETDTVVDSRDFSFLKESLCASAWNPELFEEPDEELETLIQANANKYPQSAQEGTDDIPHLFADPGANNVLLPGKTGLYSIQFDIPTDWHGTKKVHLKFDNYVYDTIVTAVDTGEEATPLHFSQQTNDDSACEVFVHAEVGDGEVNYFDPGVWVYGASGDPEPIIPGTGGGGSGTSDGSGLDPDSSSSGSGSSSGIPDTGDASLPTIAGLAATAAIAGFAAYSARRTALEREGQGDDMPGIDDEDKGV